MQVTIDDYQYISQFNVATMFKKEIKIFINLPWVEKLRTFILNMEKSFWYFRIKGRWWNSKTLQWDQNRYLHQNNLKISWKWAFNKIKSQYQECKNEFDEVIMDKNEENSLVIDHSQKLLAKVKKSNAMKQSC